MGSFDKEFDWLKGMKGKDVAKLNAEIGQKRKAEKDIALANQNISKICKKYDLKDIVKGKFGKRRYL